MQSSRTERRTERHTDALAMLDALGKVYDQAFGALQDGELERIDSLLDAADDLLGEITDADARGEIDHGRVGEQASRVRASHGRLTGGIAQTTQAVRSELDKVRRGKRGLRGYGQRGESSVGHRLSSRA